MSSCMIKLEFLLEPYMLFRLGKLHICCLLLYWVLSSFVDPYERFVMLLKSRSRTHHLDMHYSYTRVGAKTCLSSRFTRKCFTPTLGANNKNILDRFSIHQINAPSSCWYLSQSFVAEKRHRAMQKLFIKKEKKRIEKWTSVRDI